MSDEEKKAIELLKKLQKKTPYIIWGDGTPYNKNNQIQTILNLIEKLQKEIEEKNIAVNKMSKDISRQLEEIEELKEKNKTLESLLQGNLYELYLYYKELASKYQANSTSKDKIRERIKHNEEQKNIVESVGKIKINDDGINGEGIEGLNDLIVYKSYEAVINELNYLLEE